MTTNTPSPPTPVVQQPRQIFLVEDAVPILDTARFEHMQRIARIMAESSMIPDSLRLGKLPDETGRLVEAELPASRILANCFMVVNQAVRWGMDPFAVAQCCSMVHGRLMYEGKLVAAVLEAKLRVRLKYTFTNEDKPIANRELGVIVSATIPGEDEERTVEGTVALWHRGDKSPWANPGAWKRQLRYMGAREWARAHSPAIMLGVITDDEIEQAASRPAPTPITLNSKPQRVTAATAKLEAPAQFSTDGLPSVDAAPAPAAAPSKPSPTPAASNPQATVAESNPQVTEQPAFDLEPDDDEGDAVIGQIRVTLATAKTPKGLASVWAKLGPVIESLEPDRLAAAEQLYADAVERVGKKQAAE